MPKPLSSKISKEHLAAYKAWEMTAKQVAEIYDVCPAYIYQVFQRPKKPKPPAAPAKSDLAKARRAYRLKIALATTARKAAEASFTSLRTMYRYRALARALAK